MKFLLRIKFFVLVIILLFSQISRIDTAKLIYYPEDYTALDKTAYETGEMISSAFYFATSAVTTTLYDYRNGMKITPWTQVSYIK